MRRAGLAFVVLWFVVGGIGHFAAADLVVRMVPPWVPSPRAVVFATGVLELLGAAALVFRPTRRLAGWCLFALTIAVTPANVHMLARADLFPWIPYGLLVGRLPLQLVLLALIVWSTAPAPLNGRRALFR